MASAPPNMSGAVSGPRTERTWNICTCKAYAWLGLNKILPMTNVENQIYYIESDMEREGSLDKFGQIIWD